MNKKTSFFGAFALLTTVAFGQSGNQQNTQSDLQLNTITTAVPFLQITPDSRSGAMGNTGTALSPSASSFFWNTSMLSFSEEKSEIALSYTPWLRNLASDINLSNLSGYYRISDRNTLGASLRFFSLGEIMYTDKAGKNIGNHEPTEFEVLVGYAFKLNNNFSLGLNGKFIYSNLTANVSVGGGSSKAGLAGAADVSFSYNNESIRYGRLPGKISAGITINNLGNKIAYSSLNERDFLPTNLKLGAALTFDFDKYNSLTWGIDISKLLVPTSPIINNINGDIISGRSSEVGVVKGMLQSFYDAPGALERDENGNYVKNPDGSYKIAKGSKLKEELSEIMIGTGLEYWYNQLFAVRAGYFFESPNKGGRQFLTFGVGLRYKLFGVDFSYLTSLSRNSPLQNTVRFTLRLHLGYKSQVNDEMDSTQN